MMRYEDFKEKVQENFLDYLDIPNKELCETNIKTTYKVNQVLDALSVHAGDNRETVASPTLYVQEMYEHYEQTEDLDAVLKSAAGQYMDAMEKLTQEAVNLDLKNGRDKIFMVLVNTEQNKEMLENVPNRNFQDLSVIYRFLAMDDGDGIGSVIITDALAKEMGMTEPELYQAAAQNTKELFKPKVCSMNQIMMEMFQAQGMGEMAAQIFQDVPEERMMWVITNEKGINGAASMMYEKILHDLSEKLGEDLLILPSSVHEVIAVRESMASPEELAKMVQDINMGQVLLEDRLSNQVYHYDREERKLSLATDAPMKRLDGIVAEGMAKQEDISLVWEDGMSR